MAAFLCLADPRADSESNSEGRQPFPARVDNENGVKIKLQTRMRERPALPVRPLPQLALDRFKLLEFELAAISSLAIEDPAAEKIRGSAGPRSMKMSTTFTL